MNDDVNNWGGSVIQVNVDDLMILGWVGPKIEILFVDVIYGWPLTT